MPDWVRGRDGISGYEDKKDKEYEAVRQQVATGRHPDPVVDDLRKDLIAFRERLACYRHRFKERMAEFTPRPQASFDQETYFQYGLNYLLDEIEPKANKMVETWFECLDESVDLFRNVQWEEYKSRLVGERLKL